MTDRHEVVDKGVQTSVDLFLDHIAETVLINSNELIRLMVAHGDDHHQPDPFLIPDSQPDPPT